MQSHAVHSPLKSANRLARAAICGVVGGLALLAVFPGSAIAAVEYEEDPVTPAYVWMHTLYGKRKVPRAELPRGAVIKPAPKLSPALDLKTLPPAMRAAATAPATSAKPTTSAKPAASARPANSAAPPSSSVFAVHGESAASAKPATGSAKPPPPPLPPPPPPATPHSPFRGTKWTYTSTRNKPALFEFREDGTARYFDGASEFPGTWAPISENLAFYRMNADRNFMLFFLLADDGTTLTPFRPANSGAWARLDKTLPAPIATPSAAAATAKPPP